MIISKLEKFIAKRVLILYVILTILDIALMNQRWMIFAGLTIGTLLGLFRLNATSSSFSILLKKESGQAIAKQGVIRYILNQIGTILVLVVTISYNLYIFIGVVVGVLFVTFTIIVNSITEALGITHNSFE